MNPCWEVRAPSRKKCCICERLFSKIKGKRITQLRPTGADGALQRWIFCSPCWSEHLEVCTPVVWTDGLALHPSIFRPGKSWAGGGTRTIPVDPDMYENGGGGAPLKISRRSLEIASDRWKFARGIAAVAL
jgi:hypothetical protein